METSPELLDTNNNKKDKTSAEAYEPMEENSKNNLQMETPMEVSKTMQVKMADEPSNESPGNGKSKQRVLRNN